MNIFEAILQGIIQGLTEFLPVSSSGHLSLFQHFTGLSGEASLMFSVFLHFGTLLSVVVAFRRTIVELIRAALSFVYLLFTGNLSRERIRGHRRLLALLFVGLLPMLASYFLRDFFSGLASDGDIVVEGCCFLLTALLLYLADHTASGRRGMNDTGCRSALVVGAVQGIAPLPGLSRSGSTLAAGMLTGMSREFAVEFSFLLGLPVILMANLLELRDALQSPEPVEWLPIAVGVVVAAAVGLLAIRLLRYVVKSRKLGWFSAYTAALGAVVIVIGLIEKF